MNPEQLADDPQPEEAEQSSASGGNGLIGRLLNSRGGRSLGEIQAEYGVSKDAALLVRGLQKVASADGTPAVGDMVLGAFLFVKKLSADGTTEQQQTTETRAEDS